MSGLIDATLKGMGMFDWLKRLFKKASPISSADVPCIARPGEMFAWPKGGVITAVDEVVIALPIGLFDKDRPIGEFLFGPDDMKITVSPDGDRFHIRLMPGMSVSLAKSCDAYVSSGSADDHLPRRIAVRRPQAK